MDGGHDGVDLGHEDAGWMETICGRARWGNDQSEVCVPAGPFVRGKDGKGGGAPKRVITLSAFFIDRYEVSYARYRRCVAAGACRALTYPDVTCLPNENTPGSFPVACIRWDDAEAFCAWEGRRLPTEAEWEKAARGGCEVDGDPSCGPTDERPYPWGWEPSDCTRRQCLFLNCGCPDWGAKLGAGVAPIDAFPTGTSPYGALAMGGNVEEWVSDRYDKDYYATCPSTDPPGPSMGSGHILRGDSDAELTARHWVTSSFPLLVGGLRCARTPPP